MSASLYYARTLVVRPCVTSPNLVASQEGRYALKFANCVMVQVKFFWLLLQTHRLSIFPPFLGNFHLYHPNKVILFLY